MFGIMRSLISGSWILTLEKGQRELIELSVWLYERESESIKSNSKLVDYSFILFPISKAYEGFLKKYLFELSVIDKKQYESKRFRIGRALNPDINGNFRDEHWLYDDLAKKCGDDVAREIWQTWLECRNRIFHYFPSQKSTLDLNETRARMQQVISAMQLAFTCKISPN